MKVYVATNFGNWRQADEVRGFIERRGHLVTSRWIDVAKAQDGVREDATVSDEEQGERAQRDLVDIDAAQMLVIIPPYTSGAMLELGYALGKKKLAVLVGDREHLFHRHPDLVNFELVSDFLDWMGTFSQEEIIFTE